MRVWVYERQGAVVWVVTDGECGRGGVKRTLAGMSYAACKFVRSSIVKSCFGNVPKLGLV